jgi:hypothetical protein
MKIVMSSPRRILCSCSRRFSTTALLGVILVAQASWSVRAQDVVRTVDNIYQIDERGDAKIDFDFQLGAAQWAVWKEDYGDHPDLLLRNLKHELAAAAIDDFSLEKDEIHRHAVAHVKARALARYRGDGEFQIQVPKEMKLISSSGTDWVFTNSMKENTVTGGVPTVGIVTVTYRAKLPAKARNEHLVTGNDYNQLAYTLDVSPSKPKYLFYLGFLFLAAALVLGVFCFRRAKTRIMVSPPQSPPSLNA